MVEEHPKVSVIMTTKDMAQYLYRSITSIINQTYSDLDIVFVNDGSSDDSAEILDGFRRSDPRIKVIHQENKGHSEARNVGLANSEADYIFFIDADDYIRPNAIELLINNLMETDADMSIGNYIRSGVFIPISNSNYRVIGPEKAIGFLTNYWGVNLLYPQVPLNATWNKIYKRKLFDKVKFPTGHIHDDNFVSHRLLGACEKIVWTRNATYFYYYKPHSLSNEHLYDSMDMMLAHEDRIKFLRDEHYDRYLPNECVYYLEVCTKTFKKTKDYDVIARAVDFIEENRHVILQHHMGLHKIEEILNYA